MRTALNAIAALILSLVAVNGANAQCYSSYGSSGCEHYDYSVSKVVVESYVYDYPLVPYIIVPAYVAVPAVAVQPQTAPVGPVTAATAVPQQVQPVAVQQAAPVVVQPVAVVYLQPAAYYYVPVYRTRYTYYR